MMYSFHPPAAAHILRAVEMSDDRALNLKVVELKARPRARVGAEVSDVTIRFIAKAREVAVAQRARALPTSLSKRRCRAHEARHAQFEKCWRVVRQIS